MDWIQLGYLQARKEPGIGGHWICSADTEELDRLRDLYAHLRNYPNS